MAENKTGPDFRLGTKGDLVTIAILMPLVIVPAYFGEMERGMTAACGGFAIAVVVRVCWYLRHKLWFWVLVGVFVFAHAIIAIYLPWARNDYSALMLLPIGITDFGLMYGCIRLAEEWLH